MLRYHGSDDAKLREEAKARFKDKVVFIGATAQGTSDQKPTPFEAAEAGVMKHMTALDNIMNNRFILEAPLWVSVLVALFVALLSVSLVLVVQSVVTDIGAPVFLYFFFIVTGAFLALTHWHVLSAMPSMAGTLAAVAATGFNRFVANKDRDFLKQAFSAYMEPDLSSRWSRATSCPRSTARTREITAFFSDIRGFSTFSEQLQGRPARR